MVTRYIAMANSGDFEGTFAFYVEVTVVKNPAGLFVWLRQDVQGTRATPQNFVVINDGTTVSNTGTVSLHASGRWRSTRWPTAPSI